MAHRIRMFLRDRKGLSTVEFVIGSIIMTFVMFYPIAVLVEFNSINIVQRELDRALNMAAVEGMVTPEIENTVITSLEKLGVKDASFTSNTTTTLVEKGGYIQVGITAPRPGKTLYSAVRSLIGGGDLRNEKIYLEGTVVSEYIP